METTTLTPLDLEVDAAYHRTMVLRAVFVVLVLATLVAVAVTF